MPATEEFKSIRRLALASLGRNVLHFQRVEAQLKQLLLICDFVAPHDSLAVKVAARRSELRNITMGNLVKELHQRLYSKPAEEEVETSITEMFVRLQFCVDGDPDYVGRQRKNLSELVQERNSLIHHDLAGFDPNSEENCRQWIARLDEQNTRITAQFEELQSLLSIHNEAAKCLIASMQSNEPTGRQPGS